MDILVLQIFNSLFYASVLFLIAAGLSLIFGVMRIVNMAHGTFYAVGAWPKVLFIAPLRRDRPVRSHDRVPMGREGNTGPRSDIRAQRAGMILRTSETTLRAAQ
jgi:uncharacterized iron-regulated membrane protein